MVDDPFLVSLARIWLGDGALAVALERARSVSHSPHYTHRRLPRGFDAIAEGTEPYGSSIDPSSSGDRSNSPVGSSRTGMASSAPDIEVISASHSRESDAEQQHRRSERPQRRPRHDTGDRGGTGGHEAAGRGVASGPVPGPASHADAGPAPTEEASHAYRELYRYACGFDCFFFL